MEGRTRAGLIRALASASAAACMLQTARVSPEPGTLHGAFALFGGAPKIISDAWLNAPERHAMTIRQFHADGTTPILAYDVDMQKLMHLIVVRDDFATFAHLHPAFDAKSGTFEQDALPEERGHAYYVYADTMPQGFGQQVFRFTVENGGAGAARRRPVPPRDAASARSRSVPPYAVTLARTAFAANRPQNVNLAIFEAGRPARDLRPYLGAAAHAVFVNTETLSYVHVHATLGGTAAAGMRMTMESDARAGPRLQLPAPALPPGRYKLWIEFRGARNAVYTAPFTILVR